MRHHSAAEITVTGRGWIRHYVASVTVVAQRYGGRYLAGASPAT